MDQNSTAVGQNCPELSPFRRPLHLECNRRYADIADWQMEPAHTFAFDSRLETFHAKQLELEVLHQAHDSSGTPRANGQNVNTQIAAPSARQRIRIVLPRAKGQTKRAIRTRY